MGRGEVYRHAERLEKELDRKDTELEQRTDLLMEFAEGKIKRGEMRPVTCFFGAMRKPHGGVVMLRIEEPDGGVTYEVDTLDFLLKVYRKSVETGCLAHHTEAAKSLLERALRYREAWMVRMVDKGGVARVEEEE